MNNNQNNNGINNMINQNNNGIYNMVNQNNSGINNMVNQNNGMQNNAPQNNNGVYIQGGNQETSAREAACPKCGFKLNPNSSICMHCGMKINNVGQEQVEAAFGGDYSKKAKESYLPGENYLENKKKFLIPILIVNGIQCLLFIFGMIYLPTIIGSINGYSIDALETTLIVILSGSVFITYFYIVCYQILLAKDDLPWWGVYIPIYSSLLTSKLMTNDYFYMLLVAIPSVILSFVAGIIKNNTIVLLMGVAELIYGLIIYISVNSKFSRKFGVNAALLFFFPFVMIPIMAFSDRYISNY